MSFSGLSSCSCRPAAFFTSSASFPGSLAAYMTFVNCVARGCGTAATSPLWNVPVNIQIHRAAPMEAPPPHSPPRPPRHTRPRPHQTSHPHPRRRARRAPKPGTFSTSGSSPEEEILGRLCWVSAETSTASPGSTSRIPGFAASWLLSPVLLVCSHCLNKELSHLILSRTAAWNTSL